MSGAQFLPGTRRGTSAAGGGAHGVGRGAARLGQPACASPPRPKKVGARSPYPCRGGILAIALALFLLPALAHAQGAIPGALDRALAQASPGQGPGLSLSLQLLLVMGLLTLMPGLLLMMTSFTRILVVLSILRKRWGCSKARPIRC